ncbi:BTB/POZ protein, partial [Glomus cerebriforme]
IFLLARLSQNFETLLKNSNNNDVIINVGSESNSKTFYAHSLILTSQSTYFRTALSSNWIKKDDDMNIIFEKPNVSPKIFETILRHLYCGIVTLNEFTTLELLDLISSADEFMLPELMNFIESHLLSLADSWMNTDFIKVHLHAQKFSECKNLREFCIKRICKNPDIRNV